MASVIREFDGKIKYWDGNYHSRYMILKGGAGGEKINAFDDKDAAKDVARVAAKTVHSAHFIVVEDILMQEIIWNSIDAGVHDPSIQGFTKEEWFCAHRAH